MFIDGIGISGYRSFGRKLKKIGPFEKVNLIIGQNNSGKSNILTFLANHYNKMLNITLQRGTAGFFEGLDLHIGMQDSEVQVSFGLRTGGDKYNTFLEGQTNEHAKEIIRKILGSTILTHGEDMTWFVFGRNPQDSRMVVSDTIIDKFEADTSIDYDEWQHVWCALTGGTGGGLRGWRTEVLQRLSSIRTPSPPIQLIKASRQVGVLDNTNQNFSGGGLIKRLAALENPGIETHVADRKRFDEINDFLRNVTGNDSSTINVPSTKDTILVHMDGKILPLIQLGTGIHEVIILAVAATVIKKQVLCIEEPEIHLHPILQKKLIRYLSEKTDNQYFITTHSAHLLDTPDASIFHVRHQEGQSIVERASTDSEKSLICDDLGFRASDLMQANSIIWVEGPSDRIYINNWIKSVDSELIEGIHYSIMFYGGRLLSHLSADDESIEEFILLRRLNRHISVVIDSDRTKKGERINKTKSRVCKEFDKGPGFAWVTQGREIENYLDETVLELALKKAHPKKFKKATFGQFENNLKFPKAKKDDKVATADKVKIAHIVTETPANLDILDLKPQINKLVKFIRDANDFEGS